MIFVKSLNKLIEGEVSKDNELGDSEKREKIKTKFKKGLLLFIYFLLIIFYLGLETYLVSKIERKCGTFKIKGNSNDFYVVDLKEWCCTCPSFYTGTYV